MKGKKWLAKPLAFGLAIATAVTSMGIPGGLFAPQTAYAAEDEDNSDGSDGVAWATLNANTWPNGLVVRYNDQDATNYNKDNKFNVDVTVTAQTADGKGYIISDRENDFTNKTTEYIIKRPADGEHDPNEGDVYKIVPLYFKDPESNAIYKKIIYIYFDVLAPTLTVKEPTGANLTDKKAVITVTSSEDADVYYWLTETATIPDAQTIKKNASKQAVSAKTATDITVANALSPESTRYVYVIAEDKTGNLSEVKSVSFTTRTLAIQGNAKLEGRAVIGNTLTASIEDGITDANYQYKFIGIGNKVLQEDSKNTYIITKDDFGAIIRVIITAEGYSSSKEARTSTSVMKKECPVTLSDSIFGDVEGTGASKVLKINIPTDLPTDAKLEYSFSGGTDREPWMDLVGAAIPVGNKGYTDGNICVRVKATDDTYASCLAICSRAIKGTLEGKVTITGTMKFGETIKAEVTGKQDNAWLKYQIVRLKNGVPEYKSEALVKNQSYTLTKEDIGSTIKVIATDDEKYDGQIESEETATIQKADARTVADIDGTFTQDGTTYAYNVTAPVGEGVQYAKVEGEYASIVAAEEAGKAIDYSSTVAGLEPNKTYTIFATYADDGCYEKSDVKAKTIVVPKLKHAALSLHVTVADTEGAAGKKTVTIAQVEGAEYSFDGGKTYVKTNTKDFAADTTDPITVAIRYEEDDKYESVVTPLIWAFNLNKAIQEAPDAAGLEYAVNAEKAAYDIFVTEPNVSGGEKLEYSTDGVNYSALSAITTTGLPANTIFTLYVRKAATTEANASLAKANTITTPDVSAAPAISGKENFKNTTTVKIVGSGDIYYTIDGSTPTASMVASTRKYTGEFTLSTTRTIKAIAVENGRIMSAVTEKTFTKETAGGDQGGTSSGGSSGGGSSSGSSGGGSSTTPSKDDTKTDDTKKDDTKKDDTTKTDPSKTEISAEKIAEAAGTKDAEVTVKTVDANGKTVREVTAKASDLVAGKKVKVIKIDPKTGEKTLVNETSYRVAADGSLVLDDLGKGNYKVVSLAEANALTKEILQTIKPQKTKMNLTVGKKTKFKFDDALNMDNVAKITYKTDNKSIATINKDGTITAKKAGKVTIKAVVTLKNGKKKTVKMTITVKKKK